MPLQLITGRPGTGKTLWTINEVEKLRHDTGREVYYHGIPELTLPWHKLEDPLKWYQCPEGAIIVIDEVQKLMRVRKQGSEVPKYVTEIETHRHLGFDLFWMTQDAMLVDINVRKLVDKHRYLKRIYGTEAATLYTWNQRVARVESQSEYHDAIDEKFLYPKKVYGQYESARVHTVQSSFPWKKVSTVVGLALLFVAALVYVSMSWTHKSEAEHTTATKNSSVAAQSNLFSAHGQMFADPWDDKVRKPRISQFDNSAPYFDELQRAQSQPKLAGCMSIRWSDGRTECRCSTSQGSRVQLSQAVCLTAIKNGWFDSTKPEVDVKAMNIAYLNSRDASSAQTSEAAPAPKQSSGQGS